MKKIKSLLSLMLVMILMLSMAGPMAFAEGNNTLTITAREPIFDAAEGKWKDNGYTYTCGGFDDTKYNIGVEVKLDVSGGTVTATPVLTSFTTKDDSADRKDTLAAGQPVLVSASTSRNALTVKAKDPVYNNGTYSSSFVVESGTLAAGHYISNYPEVNVSADGNSVVADAAGLVILNASGQNVNNWYDLTKVNATRNVSAEKPNLTVTAAAPRFDSKGIMWCPGPETENVKLTIDGSEIYCRVAATGSVEEKSDCFIASLSDIKVYTTKSNGTEVEITDKVNITSATSTLSKGVITVTLNAPTKSGLNFVANSYSYSPVKPTVSLGGVLKDDLTVTLPSNKIVITDNTEDGTVTASASASDVVVMSGAVDVTDAFVINVVDGEYTKPIINISPKKPVYNETTKQYADAGFTHDAPAYAEVSVKYNVTANGSNLTATPSEYVIKNGSKEDITHFFKVNAETKHFVVNGTIVGDGTIINPSPSPSTPPTTTPTAKIKLVIKALDAEKAYNGYSFSSDKACGVKILNEDDLLEGHKINNTVLASLLKIRFVRVSDGTSFNDYQDVYKVGTYTKKIILPTTMNNVILDAANNDVTAQYEIVAESGSLTIYNAGWVSPDTGDHSNIALWIVLLAVSAVAVAAVVFVVLKKSKKA